MTQRPGTVPPKFKGKDKEAYGIASSRGYSHAIQAFSVDRNPSGVGPMPERLKGHWSAWAEGWEAGESAARAGHES